MYNIPRILNDITHTDFPVDEQQAEYNAFCPFHHDTHPSLSVDATGRWYCPVCGFGGGWIGTLVQRLYGIDEFDCLDLLYPYITSVNKESIVIYTRREKEKLQQTEERHQANLFAANAYAQGNFFGDSAANKDYTNHTPGYTYLYSRGFLASTLRHFHVVDWQRFPEHPILIPLQFDGVTYGYVQRSIDRYVFPKYLTMVGMRKSDWVYGYTPDTTADYGLLVEGMTDLLMSWQYGWKEEDGYMGGAILGSSVSFNQALMIAPRVKVLLSGFDVDAAGEKAHASLVQQMHPYGQVIKRVHWPMKDPGLCTKREFWQAIHAAQNS